MKYHTLVEGHGESLVELTADGVQLDGEALDAELATLPGGRGLRHLRVGDRGFRLHAVPTEGGWEIRIGGRSVTVTVEDERTRAIREMAGEEMGPAAGGEVRAPMPGMVVKLLVEPGQAVEPGTPLLTMEAMKMENELRAERGGVVERIEVEEGETVGQDAVLVTLAEAGEEADA